MLKTKPNVPTAHHATVNVANGVKALKVVAVNAVAVVAVAHAMPTPQVKPTATPAKTTVQP